MRMPSCAVIALLVAWSACSQSMEDPPESSPGKSGAASCKRARAPKDLDPTQVEWQLVMPPKRPVDTLLDDCEIVSLAHEPGMGGGKLNAIPQPPSTVLSSSDATHWKTGVIDLNDAVFQDLAHGKGTWVAVGGSGFSGSGVIAIADRPDSDAWREVFTSDDFGFDAIAFGAGTFVAVTRSAVAFSSDAEHWSWGSIPPQSPPPQLFDVAFGNGRFVIAGVGAALTSEDGETWQRMTCSDRAACATSAVSDPSAGVPADEQLALQQVDFLGGKFYAFGGSGGLESSDGVTFQRVPVTIPSASIGGTLVSFGLEPVLSWIQAPQAAALESLFVSQDEGKTWSNQPFTKPTTADCTIDPCAVFSGGILVAHPKSE